MILDINTMLSLNQAVTVTAASTFTYDTAGLGVGQPVGNIFGTSATSFGNDIGIGDGVSPPNLLCVVGTTFVGGTSIQVQLQAAVDTSNTGTPGTWDTIAEQTAYPTAILTSGTKIAEFTVPTRYPGQGFPRFYRLNYLVVGTYTAGTIAYAGLITGRDDQPAYPVNY
jgi:hypothetical protein